MTQFGFGTQALPLIVLDQLIWSNRALEISHIQELVDQHREHYQVIWFENPVAQKRYVYV